ncbi:MAG: MMPL family transporter, partial [Gammaproteobacteria bacterium]
MTAFANFVTGRYTRWFVIFAWVVVAAMAGSLQPKLQAETSNETISYLPGESDAATVAKLQKSAFESGAETPAVIVFTARDGGSVASHQANIRKVLDALGGGSIDKTGDLVSPYSPQGQQMGMASTDGKAVFAVLPFETTDGNERVPIVADVRKLIDEQADDDLHVYVTGEAGVVADSVVVFNSMDRLLLLATVLLVLVLLLVSY